MKHEIDMDLLLKHLRNPENLLGREKMYLEELVQRSRWIPCSERMPEKYTAVLVFDNYGDMWAGQVDKNGMWCEADDYDYVVCDNICKVTYWMPMPEPPKNGGRK